MLCCLCNQLGAIFSTDFNGIVNFWKNTLVESDIEYCTDNLGDFTCILFCNLFTPLIFVNSELPHLK